jgi:tRNA splicing endonuclease
MSQGPRIKVMSRAVRVAEIVLKEMYFRTLKAIWVVWSG